jgi:hypothetical protein
VACSKNLSLSVSALPLAESRYIDLDLGLLVEATSRVVGVEAAAVAVVSAVAVRAAAGLTIIAGWTGLAGVGAGPGLGEVGAA